MIIQLKSKRKVSVTSLMINQTYIGMFVGKPEKEFNLEIINQIKVPLQWGDRKLLFLPPSNEEVTTKLKDYYIIVWLESKAIKKVNDSSELVVCWFDNFKSNDSIRKVIELGISDLNWEEHAVDCRF
jgi:hypothetical protein